MSFELGDYVKRTHKIVLYPQDKTTDEIKNIEPDTVFRVASRWTAVGSYVYSIVSIVDKLTYDVTEYDLTNFFKAAEKPSETAKKVVEPAPVVEISCTCSGIDLFRYGCRCGSIKNSLELKYNGMMRDLMGPKMGNE